MLQLGDVYPSSRVGRVIASLLGVCSLLVVGALGALFVRWWCGNSQGLERTQQALLQQQRSLLAQVEKLTRVIDKQGDLLRLCAEELCVRKSHHQRDGVGVDREAATQRQEKENRAPVPTSKPSSGEQRRGPMDVFLIERQVAFRHSLLHICFSTSTCMYA